MRSASSVLIAEHHLLTGRLPLKTIGFIVRIVMIITLHRAVIIVVISSVQVTRVILYIFIHQMILLH